MDLKPYSRNRLLETMVHWSLPKEFADPMYNYLVHGFSPGGCFTSVLANDFYGAIQRSHPANTVEAFKALTGWIRDTLPAESHGNYVNVENWLRLNSNVRREVLEKKGLIFTEDQEMWMTLKGQPTVEPMLF